MHARSLIDGIFFWNEDTRFSEKVEIDLNSMILEIIAVPCQNVESCARFTCSMGDNDLSETESREESVIAIESSEINPFLRVVNHVIVSKQVRAFKAQ